jgi:sialic acid synthase SpsE
VSRSALLVAAHSDGEALGYAGIKAKHITHGDDVKSGEVLTKNNLRIIRPGFGIEPKYYNLLICRKVNKTLRKGARMSWEHIV